MYQNYPLALMTELTRVHVSLDELQKDATTTSNLEFNCGFRVTFVIVL